MRTEANEKKTSRRRVYISLPITGHPYKLVELKAEEVKRMINRSDTAVSPLDLCGEHEDYPACMGKCVDALLRCDTIYLCRGWQKSRGCRAEYELACIYGKEILFE